MLKKPQLRIAKEDPPIIVTNRFVVAIGYRRYAFDTSTKCTELKSSPAHVIPSRNLALVNICYHLRSSGRIADAPVMVPITNTHVTGRLDVL